MKKLFFFTFLAIAINNVFSQNAFYDAQYLATVSKENLDNMMKAAKLNDPNFNLSNAEIEIVNNYNKFIANPFDKAIDKLDISLLSSAITKYNKYVEIERQKWLAGNPMSPFVAPVGLVSALSLIPNIIGGNFSLSPEQQTKIIDGLTKYYAEEFRRAQLISYMQTFESTIGKIGELKVLFPKTYDKLRVGDPSRFPELGDEYKAVFNDDLKLVIDNLINHIDTYSAVSGSLVDKEFKLLNAANVSIIKSDKYYGCFKIAADVGSKLCNNYHPVDLLNHLDNKYYFEPTYYDQANSTSLALSNPDNLYKKLLLVIHGLNIVQRNVLDTSKNKDTQFANVWLSLQDLKKLDTKDEWLFFAGLIYQQDKEFFNKFFFNAAGKNSGTFNASDIANIKNRVEAILAILTEIQDFRSNLKEENLKDNFVAYMELVLESMQSANNFYDGSLNIPKTDLDKYIKLANYTIKIYDNARKKDYNNSIYYAVEIIGEFLGENATYIDVVSTIDHYGNFMTDVVNAKNSDETKEVIKKFAAPPASFVLKREYQRTLSITGQPGYFVSMEKLEGNDQKFQFVSGITLPLGIEFSFKDKKGNQNSASWGVFAQLIDLGAILNFRVDDETSTLPDLVEFKQIFSPGGSFSYGFKNSPMTIGLGYQYTPELRKVTENGNEVYPNGHRVFLRLAWDIPLINIARSKTK